MLKSSGDIPSIFHSPFGRDKARQGDARSSVLQKFRSSSLMSKDRDRERHGGNDASANNGAVLAGKNPSTWCTCCPYGYHIDLDFVKYAEHVSSTCSKSNSSKQLQFFKQAKARVRESFHRICPDRRSARPTADRRMEIAPHMSAPSPAVGKKADTGSELGNEPPVKDDEHAEERFDVSDPVADKCHPSKPKTAHDQRSVEELTVTVPRAYNGELKKEAFATVDDSDDKTKSQLDGDRQLSKSGYDYDQALESSNYTSASAKSVSESGSEFKDRKDDDQRVVNVATIGDSQQSANSYGSLPRPHLPTKWSGCVTPDEKDKKTMKKKNETQNGVIEEPLQNSSYVATSKTTAYIDGEEEVPHCRQRLSLPHFPHIPPPPCRQMASSSLLAHSCISGQLALNLENLASAIGSLNSLHNHNNNNVNSSNNYSTSSSLSPGAARLRGGDRDRVVERDVDGGSGGGQTETGYRGGGGGRSDGDGGADADTDVEANAADLVQVDASLSCLTNAELLEAVRKQMAVSLQQIKLLEQQVSMIPKLTEDIRALQEEKKLLQHQLHGETQRLDDRGASPSPSRAVSDHRLTTGIARFGFGRRTTGGEGYRHLDFDGGYDRRSRWPSSSRCVTDVSLAVTPPKSDARGNLKRDVKLSPALYNATGSGLSRTSTDHRRRTDCSFNSPRFATTTYDSAPRRRTTSSSDHDRFKSDFMCVSDSEVALGDRSLDRFAPLRRSRQLLRHHMKFPSPPSTLPFGTKSTDVFRNRSFNDHDLKFLGSGDRYRSQPQSQQVKSDLVLGSNTANGSVYESAAATTTTTTTGATASGLSSSTRRSFSDALPTNSCSTSSALRRSNSRGQEEDGKPSYPELGLSSSLSHSWKNPAGYVASSMTQATSGDLLPLGTGPCPKCGVFRDELSSNYARPFCESVAVGTEPTTLTALLKDSGASTDRCLCDSCLGVRSAAPSVQEQRGAVTTCHASVNTEPTLPDFSVFTDLERLLHSVSRGTNTTMPSTRDAWTNATAVSLRDNFTNTLTPTVSTTSTATDVHAFMKAGFLRHASTSTGRREYVSIGFNTEETLPATRRCADAGTDTADMKNDAQSQKRCVDRAIWTEPTNICSVGISTDSTDQRDAATETKEDNQNLNVMITIGINTDPVFCGPPRQPMRTAATNTAKQGVCHAHVLTDSCAVQERATTTSVANAQKAMQTERLPCFSIGINTEPQHTAPTTQTSSALSSVLPVARTVSPSTSIPRKPVAVPYTGLLQIDPSYKKPVPPAKPTFLTLKKTEGTIEKSAIPGRDSHLTEAKCSSKSKTPQTSPQTSLCYQKSPQHNGDLLEEESVKGERQTATSEPREGQEEDEGSSEESVADEDEELQKLSDFDDDDALSYVSSESRPPRKIDFTKPRPTRAFALSKAAAAKKLLTSSQGSKPLSSGGGSLGSSPTFTRSTFYTRSMRVDTRKGDSLAYITDRKQQDAGRAGTAMSSLRSVGGSKVSPLRSNVSGAMGSKSAKWSKSGKPSQPLTKTDLGLMQSPAACRSRKEVKNVTGAGTDSTKSGEQPLQSGTGAKEEEACEAIDTIGPLPSDVMKTSKESYACDDDETSPGNDRQPRNGGTSKREGANDSNRSGQEKHQSKMEISSSSESEVSLDEGSYDLQHPYDARVYSGDVDRVEAAVLNGELEASLQILAATLRNTKEVDSQMAEKAKRFVQQEWLKAAARRNSNAHYVERLIDELEGFGTDVMAWVVNACDENGNTALHYAVSYGNFDVVSVLLDSKVCNLNRPNKVGYTAVMLGALCDVTNETNRMVIQRLFQMGDVNVKADQHGQTALMLAVSQNKIETVRLLLDAGAGVNMQDDDGSTALMCAAEHGHKDIASMLLAHPDIDASLADNDGSTALSIAVDSGYKNIGVLIYAHLNYGRNMSTSFSKRFFKSFGSVLS